MKKLFSDLKNDEEKSEFFLSGRGYETGVIAPAIQNDVAMAYHRCAEYEKEVQALREDAERYRFIQSKVYATNSCGRALWKFHFDNPTRGSVMRHFDAAIDHARRIEGGGE